jgi:hypothetical protein
LPSSQPRKPITDPILAFLVRPVTQTGLIAG